MAIATTAGTRRSLAWLLPAGLGVLASVALAVASYRVGPYRLVVEHRTASAAAVRNLARRHEYWSLYFAGAALLVLCFVMLGRSLLGRDLLFRDALARLSSRAWTALPAAVPSARSLQFCALAWAVPLLAGTPIGSRDVWTYVAQGNVYSHHLDPYLVGPHAVPGPYLRDTLWRTKSSPYGPVFLLLARLAVDVAGRHVYVAVVLLRLVTFALWLLAVALLPVICRHFGVAAERGVWLFALNPIVLLIALDGSHNDVLMCGLLAFGIWLAVRTPASSYAASLIPAAAVITLAAEIKAPAALVLAFLPAVWLQRRHRPADSFWRALAVVVATGVVVAAVVYAVSGLGFGWVHRIDTTDIGISWLSIPTTLVIVGEYLRGVVHVRFGVSPRAGAVAASLSFALALAVIVPLWWRARRHSALPRLALALMVSVALSSSVLPWYLCWPLLIAGMTPLPDRWLVALGALSVGLTLGMEPSGLSILERRTGLCVLVLSIVVTWLLLSWPRPVRTAGAELAGPANPLR